MTGVFEAITESGRKRIELATWLDVRGREQSTELAHAWIKALRHVPVGGQSLRQRFTFRGDSLWWFAELYLHKSRRVLAIFQTLAALEALIAQEHPLAVRLLEGDQVTRLLAPQVFGAHGVPYSGPRAGGWRTRLALIDLRARWLHHGALVFRGRRRVPPVSDARPVVAAFVHRAFWRGETAEGGAEAYIGPVLARLEHRLGPNGVAYVSVGPRTNFGARRWWHAIGGRNDAAAARAIETYAPVERLGESRALWRQRYENRKALWDSSELRQVATIRGCNCWPIIREELSGVALLQWPWSARIMDEAAAAVELIRPQIVVTYAEAGGWGRALMLESRRRGIRSIGIQHGFIYRHWLNYLHEPDEMQPDPVNLADAGFPRPSLTLVFDRYAAEHLVVHGRFPPESLLVTGSPRLDELVKEIARLREDDVARARADAGCAPGDALVLVTTKYREARELLPRLLDAAAGISGVRLAIKPHPADAPDAYGGVVAGRSCVVVLPPSARLGPLLRASRAVVTVNSTVALDAAVVDIPALVIGLPNNLSPFVDAGMLAGADDGAVGHALERILFDQQFREQLEQARRQFLARYGIRSDGSAADRAADAVLGRS